MRLPQPFKPAHMGDREYWICAGLGAVIGLALSGYVLVYVPMKANLERHGCVWVKCPPPPSEAGR